MDVLIRLYNMVNPAMDGSRISREVTEEYLASEDYRTIIRDRISIGGKTHKDRQVREDSPIGPDDEVLVKRNSLFYIKKIFTTPDSDFCWAIIHIYDPENFSGELRDEIVNLRGMLNEGTKLPCSVVIQAVWSPSNECLKIIRIKGVDFTLNPSFAGSGTEKLMSTKIVSDASETKMFSESVGARTGVRLFSFDTEVSPCNDNGFYTEEYFKKKYEDLKDDFTKKDILNKYGRLSLEYKAFSQLENFTDKTIIKKDKLAEIVSQLQADNSSLSQEEFLKFIKNEVTPENRELFLQIYAKGIGQLQQLVNSVPKNEPEYQNMVKMKIINFLKTYPQSDKLFSLGTTVEDRFRLSAYSRLIRSRFLIRLYQDFYSKNQDTLSRTDEINLERLYVSDWMVLIKDVIPEIKAGYNISAYYQLGTLNPEMSHSGRVLTFYYRRLLISEERLGFIPQGVYKLWSDSLSDFLSQLIVYTFGTRLSEESLSFIK